MTPIWRALCLGLLPLLGTCCPTLWVQVQKDNPAPWPSVPLPAVSAAPYNIPVGAPNRFDVLERGAPTVGAPDFTDVFDLKDEAARARAASDLTAIQKTYGCPIEQVCEVPARLSCTNEKPPRCHTLKLEADAVPMAAAVIVDGRRLVVLNPPNGVPADELDVSEDLPGPTRELKICIEETLQLSRTLLSFVHLSDIQLRDPSVILTDRRLSHALDWFDPLSSFEYDEDMASYNQYLVEAVFATINKIVENAAGPDAPKFVVHTGDSIDSGIVGELLRVHTLIDRLRIPFFELLGNHDVLVFGNLTPTRTHDTDNACTPIAALLGAGTWIAPNRLCVDYNVVCPMCIEQKLQLVPQNSPGAVPIHSVREEAELVAQDTQKATRQHFMQYLVHPRSDLLAQPKFVQSHAGVDYCADTRPKLRYDAYSRAHGFDLGTVDDKIHLDPEASGEAIAATQLGYYGFVQPMEGDRNAVFIALNSEDLQNHIGGIRGRIGHEQLAWLKRVLACVAYDHPHDLVFVLAHQPLSMIDVEPQDADSIAPQYTVAKVLEGSRNVVAYLFGHNHWHSICGDRNPGGRADACSTFWEIETASLIEFPQEGRLVRIKQVSEDLAFLELSALRERLVSQDSELAHYVALARRGAERDFCYTQRETPKGRCSPDQRPYRTDGHDANARLFFRLP
jgi:3',5'-cyclic AMP phosphodiesterase CpdA